MLVHPGDLAAAQTKSMQKTVELMTELLNYAAACPKSKIIYHKSDMILHIHSDASYLLAPKTRSRAGGFHFFLDLPSYSAKEKLNGAV